MDHRMVELVVDNPLPFCYDDPMKIKKYISAIILAVLTALYAIAENHVFPDNSTWPTTPIELVCDGIGCILFCLTVITYVIVNRKD